MLNSVQLARAFNAYQLVSLIDERLDAEITRTKAGTVIVSCISDMFLDREMERSESYQLIKRCVERLHSIARDRHVAMLMTSHDMSRLIEREDIRDLLYDMADDIVRIENVSKAVRISMPNEGISMLYRPVRRDQSTLDEFMRL